MKYGLSCAKAEAHRSAEVPATKRQILRKKMLGNCINQPPEIVENLTPKCRKA
jgi:hypothetical protein